MAIKKLKYQEKAFEELKEYLVSLKSFDGNPRKAFIDVVKKDSVKVLLHNHFADKNKEQENHPFQKWWAGDKTQQHQYTK